MDQYAELTESQNSAVRVAKLSHAIADRLRSQILTGQRKPGESLPIEAELIQQFQVSRPTLREALRILEVEGMISLSRGMRSAIVQGPSAARAAEYAGMVLMGSSATLTDLHQVRLILEPPMVAALAKQKDKAFIVTLESLLERMGAAVAAGDFAGGLAVSNDFHAELIRCQENPALALIVEIIAVLARDTIKVLLEGGQNDPASVRKNMEKTMSGYRRLIDLIRAGDAEAAREFWQAYMQRSADTMRKSGIGARKVIHRPASF